MALWILLSELGKPVGWLGESIWLVGGDVRPISGDGIGLPWSLSKSLLTQPHRTKNDRPREDRSQQRAGNRRISDGAIQPRQHKSNEDRYDRVS